MNPIQEKIITWWVTYKTSKTAWLVFVLLIIGLIVILRGGNSHDTSDSITVEPRNLIDQVVLSGRTQSASTVSLGFADQGRIASVNVTEGQSVRSGQVLARLETADLQAQLKNAQAELAIAQSTATTTSSNLETITREQNTIVQNAYRKLLSSGLIATPDDTGTTVSAPTVSGTYTGPEGRYQLRIYASSSPSGASFELSGIENDRQVGEVSFFSAIPMGTKGLFIQFSPGVSYINTKWNIDIPNVQSSEYLINKNAYTNALATRDRVIADAQSQLNQSSSQSSIVSARIAQAQSTIDGIIAQINRRTITAPFSGIVANNTLRVGQSTASTSSGNLGSSTITLISPDDYEIVLKTPEINVAKLTVGQSVSIVLDAYGSDVVFNGTIVSINPAETIVDGVPVYETKVMFTETDSRIRSGMTAIATIITAEKENTISIPLSAITSDTQGSFVTVVAVDGSSEKRRITTGMRSSDGFVEILSGLTVGETVAMFSK
jgi:HlyD family secretion protein